MAKMVAIIQMNCYSSIPTPKFENTSIMESGAAHGGTETRRRDCPIKFKSKS